MKNQARRWTVGPRGGRQFIATECGSCVAFRSCRPGTPSEPFGCESWVDSQGRRALPELVEDERPAADGSVRLDIDAGEQAPAGVAIAAVDAEASGPVLVAYVDPPPAFEPEEVEGPQGVLPMPDAGPLFAAPDKRGRS